MFRGIHTYLFYVNLTTFRLAGCWGASTLYCTHHWLLLLTPRLHSASRHASWPCEFLQCSYSHRVTALYDLLSCASRSLARIRVHYFSVFTRHSPSPITSQVSISHDFAILACTLGPAPPPCVYVFFCFLFRSQNLHLTVVSDQ